MPPIPIQAGDFENNPLTLHLPYMDREDYILPHRWWVCSMEHFQRVGPSSVHPSLKTNAHYQRLSLHHLHGRPTALNTTPSTLYACTIRKHLPTPHFRHLSCRLHRPQLLCSSTCLALFGSPSPSSSSTILLRHPLLATSYLFLEAPTPLPNLCQPPYPHLTGQTNKRQPNTK